MNPKNIVLEKKIEKDTEYETVDIKFRNKLNKIYGLGVIVYIGEYTLHGCV